MRQMKVTYLEFARQPLSFDVPLVKIRVKWLKPMFLSWWPNLSKMSLTPKKTYSKLTN